MTEILQIPVLSDNYVYLVHESLTGKTAVVDPAVGEPVRKALAFKGWRLDFIWNTHHHRDHVGANLELKREFSCTVLGSKKDRARIPGIDIELSPGDEFLFGEESIKVFAADGHTVGHIVYWLPKTKALFCGDTIFSLGCGKLFEGSARQMWATLSELRSLPDDTLVYCAHEYTMENALYAVTADPDNSDLHARVAEVTQLRSENKPTVPSLLGMEKATNPFLRPDSAAIRLKTNSQSLENWEVFGRTRADKDAFDAR